MLMLYTFVLPHCDPQKDIPRRGVVMPVKLDRSDLPISSTWHRMAASRAEQQSEDSLDFVVLGSLYETQQSATHFCLSSTQPPPDLSHGTKFPNMMV